MFGTYTEQLYLKYPDVFDKGGQRDSLDQDDFKTLYTFNIYVKHQGKPDKFGLQPCP